MLEGPQLISTLLLIKPRALQRHLAKILKKITQEGFTVVGLKLLMLDEKKAGLFVPEECEVRLIVNGFFSNFSPESWDSQSYKIVSPRQ